MKTTENILLEWLEPIVKRFFEGTVTLIELAQAVDFHRKLMRMLRGESEQ